METKVKEWRLKKKNRRCLYCKYLRYHSFPSSSGAFKCEAKDRWRSDFGVWHIPRIWCECYELEDKL